MITIVKCIKSSWELMWKDRPTCKMVTYKTRQSAASAKFKSKQITKGLCTGCGRPRLCETRCQLCDDCARALSEWAKSRTKQHREEGLCIKCNHSRAEFSRSYCQKHWFERTSANRTGTTKNGPAIQDILQKQEYKCAYTGIPLKLGYNAQLDHKTPVALGGTNELSNLHWIDKEINLMKGKHTHKGFMKLCRLISTVEGQNYL